VKMTMTTLKNPRHEAFAQALTRGTSAAAAYGQVGFKPHRANAATLARKEHISVRVAELQEEQLAIHQQATAAAVANKQVTIESLIAEVQRVANLREGCLGCLPSIGSG
jgi:phage terminase small subunit